MAEAYTGDSYVSASRWKLRLIGSYNPLPSLSRDFPCSTFAIKEIRDYYIPNEKKIVFRYEYNSVHDGRGNTVFLKYYFYYILVLLKIINSVAKFWVIWNFNLYTLLETIKLESNLII